MLLTVSEESAKLIVSRCKTSIKVHSSKCLEEKASLNQRTKVHSGAVLLVVTCYGVE